MGLIHHHAVLVTVGLEDKTEILRNWIKANRMPMIEAPAAINAYVTFIMYPDGSKEGWDSSDEGDKKRAALIGFLESQKYKDGSSVFEYIEIGYGELGAQIVRTNQVNRY